MADRAFVLRPLADLAPAWRHPVTGTPIQALLAALPPGQTIERD
jgi:2-amino-4-hydroxy-6-hydroxymethyldihydropteridine diphosphokinase